MRSLNSSHLQRDVTMNNPRSPQTRYSIILLATVSLIVGCNGGNSAPWNSSTGAKFFKQQGHPAAEAVTTVKVFNHEESTIVGTMGPSPCWTVSPSPLPTASASPGHTSVITETYDPTCATNTSVTLQYTTDDVTCDFTTTWSSGFTYSA
jgi:hypothetical protein